MNKTLPGTLLKIFREKMLNRRWRQAVTCLAALVVFTTTYALILPAITMSSAHPTLIAEELLAWSGDELSVTVTAKTDPGETERIFVITAEGRGADLSPDYKFDKDGICVIHDDEGREIELHRSVREKAEGAIDYWFVLTPGEETTFKLALLDESDDARFAEIVEAMRKFAEEEEGALASASDANREGEKAEQTVEEPVTASPSNAEPSVIYVETDAAAAGTKAPVASASDAVYVVKASASDADIAEANAMAADGEKIITETDGDGFVEILDGTVINDIGIEEEEGEHTEIVSELTLSAGVGIHYEAAVEDAERNADKRGDAQLKFQWKDVVSGKSADTSLVSYMNGATIAVFYDEKANIPEGAGLAVREIEKGTDEYREYLVQTKSAIGKATDSDAVRGVTQARFFDIAIVNADGEEVEPESAVKVIITYDDSFSTADENALNVVHFTENDTEVIRPGSVDSGSETGGLSFTTRSFSVYALVETENLTGGVIASDGTSYAVTVKYSPYAGIPSDAELKVSEIPEGSEDYQKYLESASGVVYENSENAPLLPYARFFDISIWSGDQEIDPSVPVQVEIRLEDGAMSGKDKGVEFSAVHFGEDGAEKIAVVAEDSIAFEAESFSVYGVTYSYTVDFYYEDAEYHLDGGNEMLLSKLFEELHIERDAADAIDVVFSTPELLRVEQKDGKWNLLSLQPFMTQEALTITFSDDEEIVIRVEDAVGSYSDFGTGLEWQLSNDKKTLTVRPKVAGTDGTMPSYNNTTRPPWDTYKSTITTVNFAKKSNGAGVIKANANISYLFKDYTALTTCNLSNLKITTTTTNMRNMFNGCTNLTTITWGSVNTSKVKSMVEMFRGCSKLTSLNLNWNTAEVDSMSGMFYDCEKLSSLTLGNDFTAAKVTSMANMFRNCKALTSLNLSKFNTSTVTTMTCMFYGCEKLSTLTLGTNFTSNNGDTPLTDTSSMFRDCKALTSLSLPTGFTCAKVTNMANMFLNCAALTSLDLSKFNTSNVTTMASMFYGCEKLATLTLGTNFKSDNGDTPLTTTNSMFRDCKALTSLSLPTGFTCAGVTNMANMFLNCAALTSLDLSKFNTSKVTTMASMFYGCEKLAALTLGANFKSDALTNTSSMFRDCKALTSLSLPTGFTCDRVTNMANMFRECQRLTSLDLSNFKTQNVTNFNQFVAHLYACRTIDLSGIDTSKVTGDSGTNLLDFWGDSNPGNITTVVLGKNTDLKTEALFGSSFLRGTWKKTAGSGSNVGKIYTSAEMSDLMKTKQGTDDLAGTYERVTKRSLGANFPVTYNVGSLSSSALNGGSPVITGDTNKDGKITVTQYYKSSNGTMTSWSKDYTSYDQVFKWENNRLYILLEDLQSREIEHIEVEGSVYYQFNNVVTDAEGNTYDFGFTESNFVIYDVLTEEGEDSCWYFANSVGSAVSLQSSIKKYDDKEAACDHSGSISSRQNIDMVILADDGTPVDGYYIFSAYDIDIASYRDKEKYSGTDNWYNDEYRSTIYRGYMYNSEGVYLVDGFYTDTLTKSEYSILKDREFNTQGIADFNDVVNSYRITGRRSDSGSENSEFLLKADARGASLVWTGTSCGTTIMNDYNPEVFTFKKVDEDGNRLKEAELELYQIKKYKTGSTTEVVDPPLKVSEWETWDNKDKKLYMSPGWYQLVETRTPEGYDTAETITFHINYDYEVYIVTVEGGVEVETLVEDEQHHALKIVTMVDETTEGKIKIKKTIAGTTDPLEGAEFTVSGTSAIHGTVSLTGTTDTNGEAVIEHIPYGGKDADNKDIIYTVSETGIPEGYAAAPDQYIKVDADGVVHLVDADGNPVKDSNDEPITGNNETVLELTFKDDKSDVVGELNILKIAEGSNEALNGATFVLSKVIEEGEDPVNYTATTSGEGENKGKTKFSGLPLGTYTLRESVPPTGYEPCSETWTVTVSKEEGIYEGRVAVTIEADSKGSYQQQNDQGDYINLFTLRNEEKKLKIKKVDSLTKKPLTDATFIVVDSEGQYLHVDSDNTKTWVGDDSDATGFSTSSSGMVTIPAALPAGIYSIIETTVPNGYDASGYSFDIEVTEDGTAFIQDTEFKGVTGDIPEYAARTVIGGLSTYAVGTNAKVYVVDAISGEPYEPGPFTVYVRTADSYNPISTVIGENGQLALNGLGSSELYAIATEDCPWRIYVERPGYQISNGYGSFVMSGNGVILTGLSEGQRWRFSFNNLSWVDEDDATVFLAPNDCIVKSLTLKKTVTGTSTEKFPFTVVFEGTLRPNLAASISEGVVISGTPESGRVTFTFSLANGENITFSNIAIGTTVTVTETSHNGYIVNVKEDGQTAISSDTLTVTTNENNKEIEVINNPGHELPQTGGPGTKLYTHSGLTLLLVSAMLYGFSMRRRERRLE